MPLLQPPISARHATTPSNRLVDLTTHEDDYRVKISTSHSLLAQVSKGRKSGTIKRLLLNDVDTSFRSASRLWNGRQRGSKCWAESAREHLQRSSFLRDVSLVHFKKYHANVASSKLWTRGIHCAWTFAIRLKLKNINEFRSRRV